ncbi:MAG: hypothetical protein Q8Q20_02060 [bacterium]|nr:hypothetical protein [bacterium]
MRYRHHHNIRRYLGLFGIAFAFFFFLQYNHTLADPDSFYHAKMAMLIRDHGVITDFRWLGDFTVLGESYANQHLLYHIFLIPFVTWWQPIVGLKLATVMLAAGFITVFYWALRSWNVRFAFAWSLLLLLMDPLVFRLSLAKAPSVSLIILFVALVWISAGHWRKLLPLAVIYVWAYGGFAVLLLIAGLYVVVDVVADVYRRILFRYRSGVSWWTMLWKRASLGSWAAILSGTAIGVVIHPFFPQNIDYYWLQLFEIGIRNYRSVIGVGSEWYPYAPLDLVSNAVFLAIALVLALVIYVAKIRRFSRREVWLLLLAAVFLLLTLRSRRYVEYFVPFGAVFAFTVIGMYLREVKLRRWWDAFLRLYWRRKLLMSVVVLYFLVTVPALAVRSLWQGRNDLANGIPFTRFKEASQWLISHSRAGDIVFHSSWDEFPILFYYNDVNNYISGLDPTFMYLYDSELHRLHSEITLGKYSGNIHTVISGDFHARYVLASQDHTALKQRLRNTNGFVRVYEDTDAVIYEVVY